MGSGRWVVIRKLYRGMLMERCYFASLILWWVADEKIYWQYGSAWLWVSMCALHIHLIYFQAIERQRIEFTFQWVKVELRMLRHSFCTPNRWQWYSCCTGAYWKHRVSQWFILASIICQKRLLLQAGFQFENDWIHRFRNNVGVSIYKITRIYAWVNVG